MTRTYGSQDVYVDDDLRWHGATVIHNAKRKTLRILARNRVVFKSTDVEFLGTNGELRSFSAVDEGEGVILTSASAPGSDCGCSK